jgi:prepilin-type N-terminal cleavage/methylation domain-containing protein
MGREARGFTLMEVLVAMLLMAIVTAAVFSAYRYQMFALKGQDIQLETQEAGRGLIDIMTREIRMAGYNPRCLGVIPGITDARPQLLQVQFDLNENGTTTDPVTDAGEIVTYSFDSTSGAIQRSTGGAPVSLISGMAAGALTFTYYDANGVQLTPSGSPPALIAADHDKVRRAKVTLQLQRANPYQAGSNPLVSNFVSNIDLRNRFINGGAGCW